MTEEQTINLPTLKLPKYSFFFSVILGLLLPFMARLPIVPVLGWEWFLDYFIGTSGILFFSLFNLTTGIAWYAIGRMSKRSPLAFWFSIAGGVGFLLWAHGSMNLTSSSTVVIVLVFIPFYCVGVILASWIIGLLVHIAVKDERNRLRAAVIFGVIAIVSGAGFAVQKSLAVVI